MMTWIKSNRLLSALLLVSMGFYAYYIYNAVKWIPYPNSGDYGEGFVMNYAKMWANGTWKWDINVPPYLTMVYGVGFSILVEPLVKLFGATLWVGRIVSFISALITCGFLYLITTELSGKKSYGFLSALLPATQPIFRDWSVMARVDMPAVMFDIIGFFLVVKFKHSRWSYFAVIPFLFAMMTKLTAIAGLIAVMSYILIYNRKRFLAFAGLFGVGLIATFLLMMTISGGTYWKHIILYQNTIENIYWPSFLFLLNTFIYAFLILFILAMVYLKKCWEKRDFTLPAIFFVVALFVDMFTTLRPGAAGMYYLEAILAVSICAPLSLYYVLEYFKENELGIIPASVIMVLIALFGVYGIRHDFPYPDAKYTKAVSDVQFIMDDSQKSLIVENSAIALTMDKPLYIEFFIFTNMTRLGYWDETHYVGQYEAQNFDYVLLRASVDQRILQGVVDGNFTDNALRAIKDNYTLVYQSVNSYWPYSLFLYESNDKLKNDDRQIIRGFVDREPLLKLHYDWIWSTD